MTVDSRQRTNGLIRLMDEGILTTDWVAAICLTYMSEADVVDMLRQNDLLEMVDGGVDYESE